MMPPVDKPPTPSAQEVSPHDAPLQGAPYRIWGEGLEPDAMQQMKNACKLPVAVAGALMPDAHVGYGLPIGGVLATHERGHSVRRRRRHRVPHEDDGSRSAGERARRRSGPPLERALERETRFGMGATFSSKRQHDVMDADWNVTPVTARMKDRRGDSSGRAAAAIISSSSASSRSKDARSGSRQGLPRAAESLGKPRHRRTDRASTTAGWRASSHPGAAEGAVASRVARSRD